MLISTLASVSCHPMQTLKTNPMIAKSDVQYAYAATNTTHASGRLFPHHYSCFLLTEPTDNSTVVHQISGTHFISASTPSDFALFTGQASVLPRRGLLPTLSSTCSSLFSAAASLRRAAISCLVLSALGL